MKYEIECGPSYSVLETHLEPREQIVAEAGAMVWMSDNLKVTTSTRGGAFAGLKRTVLTGESFFQNTFEAVGGPGLIGLAPGQPGDIVAYEMNDDTILLEKSAYLASTPDVHINADFQGLRGLFSEGLFVLRVSGAGLLFFNAYGEIHEVEVEGSYMLDNGHAVAWQPSLEYQLTRARRIRSFLFADQILMTFRGHGRLWVQSRNPRSLANWVYRFRSQKSRGPND